MAEIFGKIDQFCKNIFQTAIFKWKSSHFVNFNILWLETMDSQVFRNMKILGFWRQIVKLMLGNFLGILDKNGGKFWNFHEKWTTFLQKIRNVPHKTYIVYHVCAHTLLSRFSYFLKKYCSLGIPGMFSHQIWTKTHDFK